MQIIQNGRLDLKSMKQLTRKPPLFEKSTLNFWTDSYISQHVLYAHLNPNIDAASRRPETMDRSVDWIANHLQLPIGAHILDLGCGPGLYAERFSALGFHVTGIDFSDHSIQYAQTQASIKKLPITYRCEDYLSIDEYEAYDLIVMIYGDFCVLSNSDREQLLKKIHRALKPGGAFVFDVFTKAYINDLKNNWFINLRDGFWKPHPHLVLEQNYHYPQDHVHLHQYHIIESTGELQTCNVWHHYYSKAEIIRLLEESELNVTGVFADLEGNPLKKESVWIGLVTQKPLN